KRIFYNSVSPAAPATALLQPTQETIGANLEPVLADGLRPPHPGGTLEKTLLLRAASVRRFLRELPKIFSLPRRLSQLACCKQGRFEEIFDGQFEPDSDQVGADSKPTL